MHNIITLVNYFLIYIYYAFAVDFIYIMYNTIHHVFNIYYC